MKVADVIPQARFPSCHLVILSSCHLVTTKGASIVIQIHVRHIIGTALLMALSASAIGQDSRQFYKKPETTAEFWRAMNHEIELGQYKIAAGYLKGFLARNPTDEEFVQIQDSEGRSAFQRLLTTG